MALHPCRSPAGDRLRPWLCLIVLKDEEIAEELTAGGARPLPGVVVSDAPLPSLDQGWAWTHGQVVGTRSVTSDDGAGYWPARVATRPDLHRISV